MFVGHDFYTLVMMAKFAGNRISTQTGIGTAIAIAGVAIYSLIKANMEEQKRVRYFNPSCFLHFFMIFSMDKIF